ncbi:type VII secretion protein EccB [Amycolatopsis pigmentata]|uniref:Type VII secretion protein EccB n=1 Tax=Amycolatopsis pigmentata TaxID=450801 RepID=A0ABW5G3E0_9PSEU
MQSRKDQVQAYFFVVGRLFSALTHGKPDILETPSRRFSTGVTLGGVLGGLLIGIFAIIGIYSPGTTNAWEKPGSIIIDKETGARFLFLDGKLRPVLNFSSAKLATGSGSGSTSAAAIVAVSANSLSGVPVGPPIGIPGAPDAIPQPGRLDRGPWTVCVGTGTTPAVTVLLGEHPGSPLADSEGLLVSTTDDSKYLLWRGTRYRLANSTVLAALGLNSTTPLQVPANWLNPIPPGRDLTVPKIDGTGSPGPVIDGRQSIVGQIYEAKNPALGTDQVFVVRQDGLAPLNPTTESLLLSAPSTKNAYAGGEVAPIPVSPAGMAAVPTAAGAADLAGYPSPMPHMVNDSLSQGTQPCARFDVGGNPGTTLLTVPTGEVNASSAPAGKHLAGVTADQVGIPAGTGVLARDLPAQGASGGTEFLVTDFGVKFPLPGNSAAALGYSDDSAADVPNQLLALLPTGPVLSPTAALAEGSP